MNISIIRRTGTLLMLTAFFLLATSCKNNKREAEHVAENFLQAYYMDLDFDKALQLCSDASRAAVHEQAELTALNPYAKEETPDLVFSGLEIDPDNAHTARFTYTCNRAERTLPLRKFNDKWLVDLQGGTVESSGNNDFSHLSASEKGGFTSAASGEIKYRKRRQGNK